MSLGAAACDRQQSMARPHTSDARNKFETGINKNDARSRKVLCSLSLFLTFVRSPLLQSLFVACCCGPFFRIGRFCMVQLLAFVLSIYLLAGSALKGQLAAVHLNNFIHQSSGS